MRLKIVKSLYEKSVILSNHDITLPHLGQMCFTVTATDDNGAILYYIRKKDMVSFTGSDGWVRGMPLDYYGSYKIKLNAVDVFLGFELDEKIQKTIPKFKRWLIDQDTYLGELLGSRRTAKLGNLLV